MALIINVHVCLLVSLSFLSSILEAQTATQISFIKWISPIECQRMQDEAANLVYKESNTLLGYIDHPRQLAKAQAARLAIQMLCDSSNQYFPPSPLTNDEFSKYLAAKQYRGVLHVEAGKLTCNEDERVVSYAPGEIYDHPGFTPIAKTTPFGGVTFLYEKAEKGELESATTYSDSCVTRTVTAYSRIRLLPGGLVSGMTLLNFPPWIFREIKVTQCCGEEPQFSFRGSHFPSHSAYVGSKHVARSFQEGFTEFLKTKGGTVARGITIK